MLVKDTRPYVAKIKDSVVDQMRKANVDATAEGAEVAVAQIAKAQVDAFAGANAMAPAAARSLLADVLAAAKNELQGDMAALAVKVGVAETNQRVSAQILATRDHLLGSYDPRALKGVAASTPQQRQQDLAALAPLAGVFAWGIGHDAAYANAAVDTALGAADKTAKQNEAAGGLAVHTRRAHMPAEQLRMLGDDALVIDAVARTGKGIVGALGSMAQPSLPTAGKGFVDQVKAMTDPFAAATPSFSLSPETRKHLLQVGAELRNIQHAADTDASPDGAALKAAFAANPVGHEALLGAQIAWVKEQLGGDDRYQGDYKHGDELHPKTLVRNLPIVVAAIEGTLRASRVVDDVLDQGLAYHQGAPSSDAHDLQLFLEASARWAIATKDPQAKNAVHARAVATESSLQLVTSRGLTGDTARAVLPKVYAALDKIARASGDEFIKPDGLKASGSSLVAMRNAGELLAALHGESGAAASAAWQQKALALTQRASLQDVALVVQEQFGRGAVSSDGATLRAQMGDKFASDAWFVGHVTGKDDKGSAVRQFPTAEEQLAAGKQPLSADERKDLAALLFACNVGWKQGQAFRGEGDRSRVDSTLRDGVYDAYETLVRARGDDLAAVYVVLKDAWEALEKGEVVAKEAGA